jgi:glycine oxidase
LYNEKVKSWDVIIVGAGIIGLSLSIALRKRGLKVLLLERGEPGREASSAAGGMLPDFPAEISPPLRSLASASTCMYPEFVHELQDESGLNVDLRDQGTLFFPEAANAAETQFQGMLPAPLSQLEPALQPHGRPVIYLKERSVDPRALSAAALKTAKQREVDISSGSSVREVLVSAGRVTGVATDKTTYAAPVVVNCAGAWAGQLPLHVLPTRPVKGQILSVVAGPQLRHVIRKKGLYLIPRSDGRILIGATLEEAGFDKKTDPDTIQRLYHDATVLVPDLSKARILEAWAGLRPGTPDGLPLLGRTPTPGYFVAAGHFRDGILLAPVTARLMAQIVIGETPGYDLSAFAPTRFSK